MITAMSFPDVFEDYNAFKDFTDTIGLYPDTDTVSEAFNQSIYWNIVNRYGNTDVNYYEADPFKSEFTIAYEQYFKQFLSKKKIVDATNGITLDDYQIISESLSNFANNPNTLTTDPWELLTYTSQQQRGRAKAGKLTAYINALRQLPDAQIDAFLDKIDYMWSNLLSDSHACCGEDIDGTVVYVNGQYQRKWSPDTIIENIELMNEELEEKQDALTPAQQSAVDSGIDSTKVAQIQTNADNIVILQAIKYGANLQATIDTSTYIMTLQLKDQDGNNLGTAQTIDLPLESVVVSGSYDSVNKALVLTLQNGNTISIPVGDLISGLQPLIDSSHKLSADLVDDSTTTNKFVTDTEKSTWNGKQDAGEAVLFSEAQTLTDTQKAQARANIGAGASNATVVQVGGVDQATVQFDSDPQTQISANATAISGKQSTIDSSHKLSADLVDDSTTTNKFVTVTDKSTWNGKQDALSSTQLDAVNSGIDSTKVGQIATNTTNIANKANVDASNLSSTNVDSWASTCKFDRVDIIYDKDSSSSSINWGYTSGITASGNNVSITSKDFTKYKKLLVSVGYKTGSPNNPGQVGILDLSTLPTNATEYILSMFMANAWSVINNSGMQIYACIVRINNAKTSLTFYPRVSNISGGQGYNNDSNLCIMKIEGVY